MTALKGAAIARFVRNPPADIRLALVHGSDEGRIRELAFALVKAVAGSTDDPFRVTRLSEDALKEDPAILSDEARALSMTGGRRAVWVSDGGAAVQRAVELYLADPGGDGLIVIEGSGLAKTSKLRQLAEKAPGAAAIACYADTPDDLRSIAVETARRDGLQFEEDALGLLVEFLGADRAASRSEIEKLVLYCLGTGRITREDVLAVSGDASAASLEDVVDAALEGDAGSAIASLARLQGGGLPPATILGSGHAHVLRLSALSLEIEAGASREAAVRSARPPIFFARQPRVARQLALWNREALVSAARTLSHAVAQTRAYPALETALAERAVLALARRSQAMKRS
ncbi:MAG: DNA polymerase III subunit delta [Parvibaculaceae bacterium]